MYSVDVTICNDPKMIIRGDFKEFDGFHELINYIYDLINKYNLDYIEYNEELHTLEILSDEHFESNKVRIILRNLAYTYPLSKSDMKVLSDMNMYGEM